MKGVTDSKKKGMSDIAHGFTPSTSNERMNVGIRGTRNETHERPMQKQEIRENARGGYIKEAPQTRPTNNTVLFKDVNIMGKAPPKRCFLDDLDDFVARVPPS